MGLRDPEKRKAYRKAYRAANRERLREADRVRGAAYYAANRDRVRARNAAYYVANRTMARARIDAWKYKTTVEHILAIRASNKCAICGSSYKLHIDHHHKTGQLRELLCHYCNNGIENFRESPERLRAAIAYLLKHRMRGAA